MTRSVDGTSILPSRRGAVSSGAKLTVGVLGPTHMNYPQALAAVAVISNQLGEHLTRG